MGEFYAKIVGVTFENRQRLISNLSRAGKLKTGQELRFVADCKNEFDPYAVKVETVDGDVLGYLSREYNQEIFENLILGKKYKVSVSAVTGGMEHHFGINIKVEY